MLFSIIIPAYNAASYLGEALDSVARQDFSDFELIVVDDGSTDATAKIARDACEKHHTWRVISKENSGPFLARRTGLTEAKGEYVVFLDADDCLRLDALKLIAEAIENYRPDIVSFPFCRDRSFSVISNKYSVLEPGLYDGSRYGLVLEHVCSGNFNSIWGKAFKRERIDLVADCSAFHDITNGEDLLQLLPILNNCTSLFSLNEVLYFYRTNPDSITANCSVSQVENIAVVNRTLLAYAKKWGKECTRKAIGTESKSYLYLLKQKELSASPAAEKKNFFYETSKIMSNEGVFDSAHVYRLRIHQRLLMQAIKHKRYWITHAIIHAVQKLKDALNL